MTLGRVFAANIETALEQVDRKQELLEQNTRLEEFASVVSHELRNPLMVAQGYLTRARKEEKPEHFDQLEQAHDRMERIIDDLLYLAHEGDGIRTTEVVDLRETIRTAWQIATGEETTADLVIADDLGTVTADHDRLCQLRENILRNAIDHGGSDITVPVERTATGFAVADDGPGIPATEREQVFERGYSTQEGGTGFGLQIVADIVAAHGWDIQIPTSDRGGARFEISGARVSES